jgi:5-hydroxyisourate hydrolase-like protein (transthyretin family)
MASNTNPPNNADTLLLTNRKRNLIWVVDASFLGEYIKRAARDFLELTAFSLSFYRGGFMIRKLAVLLGILAMATAPAWAAVVSGVVSDTSAGGGPIQGAIVTISSFGGGNAFLDTTNATGQYSISAVTNGFHTVAAAKAGYTPASAFNMLNIPNNAPADSAITFNIIMRGLGAGGKIIGTVKDTTNNNNIAGAKVYLQQTAGGGVAIIDSATTAANGSYTLDSVQAGRYTVRAVAATYASKTSGNVTMAGTATDTVNFLLAPIQYGSVLGIVSSDSARTKPLAGVQVILARRTGGGAGTPIDTMTTGANGTYSFTQVQTGNYSVAASLTGYTPVTRNTAVGTTPDTVNIILTPPPRGSLYVYVGKSTDSSAIAGASVTATTGMGGTLYTGNTSAQGWAMFSNIPTGTYTVNVSMVGYTSRTANNRAVANNAIDTTKVYMVASTAATKTLMGTVADSATGNPIAGVLVVFRTTGGGGVTLFDSTDANGKYSIAGISMNTNTGTVAATKTGYNNFSRNNVAVADTFDTLNFKMLLTPVQVAVGLSAKSNLSPMITVAGNGLVISGISTPTVLKLYSLNGILVYRMSVKAGTTAVALPNYAGRTLVAVVKQQGSEFRSTVTIK